MNVPRTETEGDWLLTILRIPMPSNQDGIPFITVPIGIITNDKIIVSVCYHHTDMISRLHTPYAPQGHRGQQQA